MLTKDEFDLICRVNGKTIAGQLQKRLTAVRDEVMADVHKFLATLPIPKGGEKGIQGDRGAEGSVGAEGPSGPVGPMGEQGLEGSPGTPGERGEAGPAGERGADGSPGPVGERGEKGLDGSDGINGKDAFEIAREKGFQGTEIDWLDHIRGKDGREGRDGRDGRDGTDGVQGKDGAELIILPSLDESKSYPRGTYASHWGGLVRANRNTDPIDDSLQKAGWDVLVDGLRSVWVGDLDDPRVVELGFKSCSGLVTQKTMRVPTPLDRGVFKAGTTYSAGDGVTWAGSYWLAQKSTDDKPGENDSWRLAVKKGRDGKDGVSVKGGKGDPGRDGRDYTHPDQPRY